MSRPILAFALTALVCAACNDIPKGHGSAIHASDKQRVVEEKPMEVAVAPIVNASGASIPANELRQAFQKELIVHCYTPLALEFVDRKVVDASYTPGSAQENATLVITIEKWDASLWPTHQAITARMTASLVDTKGSRESIWTATADQRFDFAKALQHLSTEGARVRHATDTIARELLARLPMRTARPGRAPQN